MKTITDAIDAINNGDEVPSKIGDFKIKWISTDAWRGYFRAIPTKKSGWVAIDSSWITGNWDDAGDNASDKKQTELEVMDAKATKDGKEMVVVFLPTSNVFSTAYNVFIR